MLRDAEDRDVEKILAMRNLPANREVSINSHEIGLAEHRAWWEKTKQDPTRRVLIYERGGEASGVVNFFDLEPADAPTTGAWGFFLDGERLAERGEVLPAWIEIMKEATNYAFDELGLDELTGEVLEHNEVVRQMNRRFRFTEGQPETQVVDGREIAVIPLRLAKADRRQPKRKSE